MINLLFYFGGFSHIGGIEVFSKNLIAGLNDYPLSIDLLVWGKNSELLNEIQQNNNIIIHRFFWGNVKSFMKDMKGEMRGKG